MSDRATTLKERLKARRSRMQETAGGISEDEPTPRKTDRTWDAAMDEDEQRSGYASLEMEEEAKESEQLVKTLKKKRKKVKQELDETVRTQEKREDVGAELQRAKQKTKKKVKDAEERSATEAEETAQSSEELLDSDRRTPRDKPPKSRERTPRGKISRDTTPRDKDEKVPDAVVHTTTSEALLQESHDTKPLIDKKEEEKEKKPVDKKSKFKSSMGASYREKLSQKMKAAKDKGKDDAYLGGGRLLKDKRGKAVSTRFDDPDVARQEDELEESLQATLTARAKFRESISKGKEVEKVQFRLSHLPTPEESYDFFTRQWDADPEQEAEDLARAEKRKKEASQAKEEAKEQAKEEGAEGKDEDADKDEAEADKTPRTPKDDDNIDVEAGKKDDEVPLLGDEDGEDESWKYYILAAAQYPGFRKLMEQEEKSYYFPSIIPTPVDKKISDEEQGPRYLEEEGLYVGQRPHVLNKSLYKMENRLVKEGKKEWFGEDGMLLALPDPLKENPSRPFIPETISEPALQTEFKQAYLNEFDSRFIDGSVEAKGQYMLAVDINQIIFQHHHLFSREHVLAARLTKDCEEFVLRSKKDAVVYLTEKLKALKSASAHVTENINKMEAIRGEKKNRAGINDQKKRLKQYNFEIRETRKQRDLEMRTDRELTKRILHQWKEIKSLRTFQRCTNTPVKLVIKKEPTNKTEDQASWNEDIEDELEEAKQDEAEEYEERLKQYRTDMEKYKQQRHAKKEAKARQKARRHKHKTGEELEGEDGGVKDVHGDADEEEQMDRDQEIIDELDLEKPTKPESNFGPEARERIVEKYEEIRRKPGEPIIIPELTHGATITPNNQCPSGERNRRNDVNRYSIFTRVLFNNKEVSKTSSKPLGQEFIVRFAQILNIEIVQWPESVKMEIYESAGLSTRRLAELTGTIPEPNVTTDNVALEEMQFTSHNKQSHSHEGVGSCVSFSFEKDNSNKQSIPTAGVFSTSVAWALDSEGQALVPPSSQIQHQHNALKGLDAIQGIGMTSAADLDKLAKWIEEARLDPNDPKNADLMYLMRPAGGGDAMLAMMRLPEHFRLEHLQEEFDIATDDDLANSKRFKFLQLRAQEDSDFRSKICPILDKEIPEDLFMEWEKKKREQEKVKAVIGDSHAAAVAHFMNAVREQVMRRMRQMMHQLTFEEVIFEDAVPNIGTILPSLSKLLEPRRPLKPVRRERKKVTAHNLQAMDVKLLVNIVRAFAIPVRAEALEPITGAGAKGKGKVKNIAGNVLVRPFVEVMFQRNAVATSVADGPNPSWNEELSIPFKAPGGDYSPASLQTVNDTLFLNLFDEYIIDTQQTDADRGASVHRRIEKRWLGTIKIPFSTIYAASRIDGTFRINKPPVLLGYTADTRNTNEEIGLAGGDHTCITLFITVEPGLTAAEPLKEKFDSNEDEGLLTASDKWLAPLANKFPKREYKCTVVDINGKLVFITRYFREIQPPAEILENCKDDDEKAEMVARYVSLIPYVSDAIVFPGIVDIWSTCDQFLQMMQGDEEEHAVLLVNYFLGIGKKAWLLLGSAIPEGTTAYVVTDEGNDFWIWNASTGVHYSYRDNFCPVQSVGCLVNHENIYANIQSHEQPSRINFDLSNTSHWKTFFNKSYPFPGLSSVQPKSLIYHETPKTLVMEITEKVERILKDKIMSWRPKYITRWNRYCVHTFRKLLLKLEETRGIGMQDEHSRELEQILGSYKLCGFPINLPYTDMEPIVEAVFATGVHRLESSNVEFALAVHIHPYPNRVLSVWVYVASLVRKR